MDSDSLVRAEHFLLTNQRENGGWGESYLACVNKAYTKEGTGEVFILIGFYFILFSFILQHFFKFHFTHTSTSFSAFFVRILEIVAVVWCRHPGLY